MSAFGRFARNVRQGIGVDLEQSEDDLINEIALVFHDAMSVRCVPSDYANALIAKVRLFDMKARLDAPPKTDLSYAQVLLAINTLPFSVAESAHLKAALEENPYVQYERTHAKTHAK